MFAVVEIGSIFVLPKRTDMTHTTPKIKVHDVVSFYIIEKEETGFKKTRHSGVVIDVFGGGFQIANADFKQGKCIPVENFICKF